MNPVRARQHGFSLLELIVVIGILGVATTLGTTAFIAMNSWWNEVRALSDLDNEADQAFAHLQEDFYQVLPPSACGATIASTHGLYQGDLRFYRVGLDDDALVIPVYVALGDAGRIAAGQVRYSVRRQGHNYALVRHTAPLGGEWSGEGTVVANNVAGVDIQYPASDGKFWRNDWNGAGNPDLVRVSLLLMDETRPDFQITRSMVLATHVD